MPEATSFESVVQSVCAEYSLPVDTPLGKGEESIVYAFDDETVLKFYKKTSNDYLQSLQDLTKRLDEAALSFATPSIKSIHERDGIFFTFERRLPGLTLKDWFPTLDDAGVHHALSQYVQAPFELGKVDVADLPFGQPLHVDGQLQTLSWPDYLKQKTTLQVSRAGERLRSDVAESDQKLELFHALCERSLQNVKRHFVHGDYFFSNVLFNNQNKITALLDFSPHTVIGDSRMDAASGIMLISKKRDPDGSLTEYATSEASRLFGEDMHPYVDLYRLFYSFNFSDCYPSDPDTYSWCIENLNDDSLWQRVSPI